MELCQFIVFSIISATVQLSLLFSMGTQAHQDYSRQSEDLLEEEGSGLGSNNASNSTLPGDPILSPSAIANIVCSFAAIVFLSTLLCYITHSFNKNQHKNRIRTTRENNRLIDRQISEARAKQEQKEALAKKKEEEEQSTTTELDALVVAEKDDQDLQVEVRTLTNINGKDLVT